MDVMAILLASLKRHHRGFVIRIVDQLFEEIQRACERNDFKESQRRIAQIKFVGECYNFRVIHTSTLFDLLYRLTNLKYNHSIEDEEGEELEKPESVVAESDQKEEVPVSQLKVVVSPEDPYMKGLDSTADSFRIRLICTILDSLGKGYFQRGDRRRSMDRFLMYFQRFIFSKSYVLMDLEFMVLDTFDTLRPALIKFQSFEEAEKACAYIEEREAAGKDIIDVLGTYQKDGGGYDVYFDETYYGEEEQQYYEE